MIRAISIVITAMFCTTLLSGCWSRIELNELGIVLAVALDKDAATGEIIMTSQFVRPEALKAEGGATQKDPVEFITTRGATVSEAVRNISKEFDRKPFYSHNKILVIDEQLAREGVLPILDFWKRFAEIRPVLSVVIAKGVPAREIIGERNGVEGIQAIYLDSMIKRQDIHSESNTSNLLDFLKALGSNEINPVTGAMEIVDTPPVSSEEKKVATYKGIKLAGTAVFKKDKLVGFLDGRETRGLNWITGKVKNGIIQVPSPGETDKLAAIEIKSANSTVKAKLLNGKYVFAIQVKEVGDLIEQQSLTNVSKLPNLEELNLAQKKVIESEIADVIAKAQQEYASDILGFGNALHIAYPDEWEKVKDDWAYLFPSAEYTVTVKTEIRRTGLLQKAVIEKERPEPEMKNRSRPYDMLKPEE
ncbi:hypothetical protein P22_3398 [Propionispora sp. 2/2-37]|uniref:Ger(x)C family spore germination protein n=1 Tax=Propionispora sp. 2/2-37 TaxID=1677858 RepID=UPI0006BB56BA|nr:Ger(x)C family spore germination protein [Propionispora sp. 2/2-37]CUH97271.1 hypothetical protein P22_3398 [Propionispora sp. 2/2-37]